MSVDVTEVTFTDPTDGTVVTLARPDGSVLPPNTSLGCAQWGAEGDAPFFATAGAPLSEGASFAIDPSGNPYMITGLLGRGFLLKVSAPIEGAIGEVVRPRPIAAPDPHTPARTARHTVQPALPRHQPDTDREARQDVPPAPLRRQPDGSWAARHLTPPAPLRQQTDGDREARHTTPPASPQIQPESIRAARYARPPAPRREWGGHEARVTAAVNAPRLSPAELRELRHAAQANGAQRDLASARAARHAAEMAVASAPAILRHLRQGE